MKRPVASLLVLIAFASLAVASAKFRINKMGLNSFSQSEDVEEASDKDVYLLKHDGSKIYGSKVNWRSGVKKYHIQLDDLTFPLAELHSYRDGSNFFIRWRGDFLRRIVRGKINIYALNTLVNTTKTTAGGHSYDRQSPRTFYVYQTGGDLGPLLILADQKQMVELFKDCPEAVALVNKSDNELTRLVKKDKKYFNTAFELYNNDCKQLSTPE